MCCAGRTDAKAMQLKKRGIMQIKSGKNRSFHFAVY